MSKMPAVHTLTVQFVEGALFITVPSLLLCLNSTKFDLTQFENI